MSEPLRARRSEIAPEPPRDERSAPLAGSPSMRWHGFLVRAMLYLAAAFHALQAWRILSGGIYFDAQVRAAVYAALPGMRALDALLAATQIAGAALQIAARFELRALRAPGAGLLKAAYLTLLGGAAAYALGRLWISALSPLSAPLIGQIGAYLGLMLVNSAYYRRRRAALTGAKGEKE